MPKARGNRSRAGVRDQLAAVNDEPDDLFADLNPPADPGGQGGDPPPESGGPDDDDPPEGYEDGRYGRLTISHRGGFSSEYNLLATLQTTGALEMAAPESTPLTPKPKRLTSSSGLRANLRCPANGPR